MSGKAVEQLIERVSKLWKKEQQSSLSFCLMGGSARPQGNRGRKAITKDAGGAAASMRASALSS